MGQAADSERGKGLSQKDKMQFAFDLLRRDYPDGNPSEAGIDQEALGMATDLDISMDEAKEYFERAIADRNRGA